MVNQKVIAVITTALILSMVIFSGCSLHAGNKSGSSSMPNSEPDSAQDSTVTSSQQANSDQESSAPVLPTTLIANLKMQKNTF